MQRTPSLTRGLELLARTGIPIMLSALLLELLSRLALLAQEGVLGARASFSLLAMQLAVQVALTPFVLIPRALAPLPALVRRLLVAGLFGVPAGLLFFRVADALSQGDWIRRQSFAPGLRLAAALLGMSFVLIVALAFFWPTERFRKTRITLAALLGAGFALGHARLLPGLYDEAHQALWVLSSLCMRLASEDLLRGAAGSRSPRAVWLGAGSWLVALALAGLLLPPDTRSAGQLVMRSQRVAPLFGTLFPKHEENVVRDQLLSMRMTEPLLEQAEVPRGTLTLPDDTNVILIVVDTFRADTLEPTRSQRKHRRFQGGDTPFLDAFVARSVRFERAYVQGAMTHLSMPALFRSREAYDAKRSGVTLPTLMAERGRYPVAVVPQYFMERGDLGVDQLLEGFAEVEVYERTRQNEQLPLTDKLLTRVSKRPFFAWIHYYAMHHPGWAGAHMPRPIQQWPGNYPRALRWLDGQIKQLFAVLERLGIADKTAIVLTCDHGEGLLDDGSAAHSTEVSEEAVRTPLAVYLPRQKPRLVPATVGNIDIVPTLYELLGGPRRPEHKGESLVPLITGAVTEWDRRYASLTSKDRRVSVVHGSQKHVFDRGANVHMHYDLASDPEEDHDLFDPSNPEHVSLLSKLVEDKPAWFKDEVQKPETQALLDRRLAEVNPNEPPRGLRFLLRVMRERPTRAQLDVAARWFRETRHDRVRLLVLEELFDKDKARLAKLAEAHLRSLADTDREMRFVRDLSGFGQPPFARDYVVERMASAADKGPSAFAPWLTLVADWNLSGESAALALASMMEAVSPTTASPSQIQLVLEVTRDLRNVPEDARARLTARSIALLDHPNFAVQAEAARTLGKLGGSEAEAVLTTRLTSGTELLPRTGALQGLSTLMGERILPLLEPFFENQGFIMSAVDVVVRLDSPATLDLLRRLSRSLDHPIGRKVVKDQLARLERRLGKVSKPKKAKASADAP